MPQPALKEQLTKMRKQRWFSCLLFWQGAIFLQQRAILARGLQRGDFLPPVYSLPPPAPKTKNSGHLPAEQSLNAKYSLIYELEVNLGLCRARTSCVKAAQEISKQMLAAFEAEQQSSWNSGEKGFVLPAAVPGAWGGAGHAAGFLCWAGCRSSAPHCLPHTSTSLHHLPPEGLTVRGSCFLFSFYFFPLLIMITASGTVWRPRRFHGWEHMQYLAWLISAAIGEGGEPNSF